VGSERNKVVVLGSLDQESRRAGWRKNPGIDGAPWLIIRFAAWVWQRRQGIVGEIFLTAFCVK
jgi:hypothetical protein